MAKSTRHPRVSVVIPALDEEGSLPYMASRVPADIDEIVVVNGASGDNTAELAREIWPNGVHITQIPTGRGNALACGFAAATGNSAKGSRSSLRHSDLGYEYNAFWRRCFDVMCLPDINSKQAHWGDGSEVEVLMNVRVAAHLLNIAEVHSDSTRNRDVSNLNAVSDEFRVLRTDGAGTGQRLDLVVGDAALRADHQRDRRIRVVFHPACDDLEEGTPA